ncbi:MAG: GNAT family N-acetyltransferase [Candidatus Aminicenantes bacterium]|nr:GNAT family N-acetyltransferase [Candidatus Aminicenantes bacterium]
MNKKSILITELAALAYGWTPEPLRRILLPGMTRAFSLIRRLRFMASQVRLPIYRLEGREKNGGRPLSILACAHEPALPFIIDLAFSDLRTREQVGRVFIWNVGRLCSRAGSRADMIVVHGDAALSRRLSARGFILIPEWVTMALDLGPPLRETWDLAKNKTVRENLRRIRKYHYSYEITTDRNKFEFFYDRMYLPFIPEKFGPATSLVGRRRMRLFFESGLLLLVKRDGEYVAGNIVMLSGDTAKSIIIGLKDGDLKYRQQSALGASYYFTMLWAKDNGLRRVDFGECRAFLNNGLLYFKKRWGMGLERSALQANVYGWRVRRCSPAVRGFLVGNPLAFFDGPNLRGLVLTEADHPLSPDELRAIVRANFVPGLQSLVVLSTSGFSPEVRSEEARGLLGKAVLWPASPEQFFRVGPTSAVPGCTRIKP